MAKEYKIGDKYYLPVTVNEIYMGNYPVVLEFSDSNERDTTDTLSVADEPDILLTAEDIAMVINTERDDALEELEAANATLEARYKELDTLCKEVMATRDEAIKQNNELIAENGKLKQQLADANELLTDAETKVKELTEADCMRLQELKPIIEERDRLKGELEQEKKRTQVWKDSAEEHRQRAEELEADVKRYEMDIADNEVKIQRLGQENNSLKADIIELKAQIDVFGSSPSEIEEMKAERDSAIGQADLFKSERDEFSEKIEKYKETLRKWTKKIRSQEEAIKQKDLIISLLAARVLELEKGGESNG